MMVNCLGYLLLLLHYHTWPIHPLPSVRPHYFLVQLWFRNSVWPAPSIEILALWALPAWPWRHWLLCQQISRARRGRQSRQIQRNSLAWSSKYTPAITSCEFVHTHRNWRMGETFQDHDIVKVMKWWHIAMTKFLHSVSYLDKQEKKKKKE